jgi:hypothetical protein
MTARPYFMTGLLVCLTFTSEGCYTSENAGASALVVEWDPKLDPEVRLEAVQRPAADRVLFQATANSRMRMDPGSLGFRLYDSRGTVLGDGKVQHQTVQGGKPTPCEIRDTRLGQTRRIIIGLPASGSLSDFNQS